MTGVIPPPLTPEEQVDDNEDSSALILSLTGGFLGTCIYPPASTPSELGITIGSTIITKISERRVRNFRDVERAARCCAKSMILDRLKKWWYLEMSFSWHQIYSAILLLDINSSIKRCGLWFTLEPQVDAEAAWIRYIRATSQQQPQRCLSIPSIQCLQGIGSYIDINYWTPVRLFPLHHRNTCHRYSPADQSFPTRRCSHQRKDLLLRGSTCYDHVFHW